MQRAVKLKGQLLKQPPFLTGQQRVCQRKDFHELKVCFRQRSLHSHALDNHPIRIHFTGGLRDLRWIKGSETLSLNSPLREDYLV
jgi:hypothetical protein